MKLHDLEKELSEIYQFEKFDDYCHNGIQVEGKEDVEKILLSVNISNQVIDYAIKEKADAIIVHHGFFGKSFLNIKGNLKVRIKKLLENDISLIGIHLPMDANTEIGHNKVISNIIGLDFLETFNYGFIGKNIGNLDIFEIKSKIEKKLSDNGIVKKDNIRIYDYLNKKPEKIAVISGEAYKYFEEAIYYGVDLFITGSIAQHIPEIAIENRMAILTIGHYNSEIFGIVTLSNLLKESFNLKTSTIFLPNDL